MIEGITVSRHFVSVCEVVLRMSQELVNARRLMGFLRMITNVAALKLIYNDNNIKIALFNIPDK